VFSLPGSGEKLMAISINKKRVVLSLDKKNVEEYQSLCKHLNMPANSLSMACDEFLEGLLPMLQVAASGRQLSIPEFFTYLGKHVQEIVDQENIKREVQACRPDRLTVENLQKC
jgi:hypothetical protein